MSLKTSCSRHQDHAPKTSVGNKISGWFQLQGFISHGRLLAARLPLLYSAPVALGAAATATATASGDAAEVVKR